MKTATEVVKLDHVISDLLPSCQTGSVEVQRDIPHHEHEPHTHPCDELLHVIRGSITFYIDGEPFTCFKGDRLSLKRNTPHSSKAGPNGCTYVIAVLKS
ncbi:cupin domain-containing protein [Geomicrobium sp. JCM 19039]|uniref:cupin domain-containing protein n=1 Tax=Geomicrobium sp. JCM 19039 TaxID=1460636 RepID=UPI00045F168C|nr:cupin domain-containing protein [Geomicrobium sp. JCM 19039]GAK13414.1 hypothetical protein JCM19039_3257 [Geomicrobium sp. JCM 19039]